MADKTPELAELIEPLVDLACAAGRKILAVYNSDDVTVEEKDDKSPLTAADMASHHAIVDGLAALTPDIPVLSEESASLPFSERASWSTYWLVDPLDGTREFIKRNGEFTVNIALIEDGVAVLGVVHVPVTDTTYLGCRGAGAFKQTGGSRRQPIHVRRLGDSPVMVVGSRSHRGESLNKFLDRLGDHAMVGMGSSLKLCLVAEGVADIYPRLGPTSEWDTAAAHAVVLGAGGQVVDCDGNPLRYNAEEDILNPWFLVYGDGDRNWTGYVAP